MSESRFLSRGFTMGKPVKSTAALCLLLASASSLLTLTYSSSSSTPSAYALKAPRSYSSSEEYPNTYEPSYSQEQRLHQQTTRQFKASSNDSTTIDSLNGQNLDGVAYNPIFIFMCIVYTISTLSACITNLIVLLVYMLGRSKTELSIFLINLAMADFLMSTVCMPFTFAQALLKRWIFGEIMCPIGNQFFFLTNNNS
jgi:Na+/melibiose symporter-like transporter